MELASLEAEWLEAQAVRSEEMEERLALWPWLSASLAPEAGQGCPEECVCLWPFS